MRGRQRERGRQERGRWAVEGRRWQAPRSPHRSARSISHMGQRNPVARVELHAKDTRFGNAHSGKASDGDESSWGTSLRDHRSSTVDVCSLLRQGRQGGGDRHLRSPIGRTSGAGRPLGVSNAPLLSAGASAGIECRRRQNLQVRRPVRRRVHLQLVRRRFGPLPG